MKARVIWLLVVALSALSTMFILGQLDSSHRESLFAWIAGGCIALPAVLMLTSRFPTVLVVAAESSCIFLGFYFWRDEGHAGVAWTALFLAAAGAVGSFEAFLILQFHGRCRRKMP